MLLASTTILRRWPPEGHCRLVFPRSCDMTWHCSWLAATLFRFATFLSRVTRHNFHRLCQSIFLEESCRILSGFDWIYDCSVPWEHPSSTFSNWCLFHFLVLPIIRCNVFFLIVKTCSNNKWKLKYSLKSGFLDRRMLLKSRTGKRERATGNGELGTGNLEQGTWNREHGAGNRKHGAGNREQGAGSREQGTGNRKQETGNRKQ